MAMALVQQATASSAAASTSLTCTLGSTPVAGNFLVFAMAGDGNTGALTLDQFTVMSQTSASVTCYYCWKVCYGGIYGNETAISPSWATPSVAGNMAWYAEYTDATVSGEWWDHRAQAAGWTNETNVLSQTTGSDTVTSAGLGIAVAAVDSSSSVTAVSAWGNGYTARYSGTGGGARGGIFIAEKPEVLGAAATSTFTFTGTADQVSAAIVVFSKIQEFPEIVMAPHRM